MTPLRKAGLTLLMIAVGVIPALTLFADPFVEPGAPSAKQEHATAVAPPTETDRPDRGEGVRQPAGKGQDDTERDDDTGDGRGQGRKHADDGGRRDKARGEDREVHDDEPDEPAEIDDPDDEGEDDQWISITLGNSD